ncbi:MAG TPA: hypothetical protein VK184_07390 [Nostocaceae cyanobacterium]|nr:hypothetical protein [Nostocaceae cyanobacterium]
MSSQAIATIIEMIESLPAATQEQLVEYLQQYIAKLKRSTEAEIQNTEEDITENKMQIPELSHDVADIFNPNLDYPIWSPYDSYEAAHKLAQMLEEDKKAQ